MQFFFELKRVWYLSPKDLVIMYVTLNHRHEPISIIQYLIDTVLLIWRNINPSRILCDTVCYINTTKLLNN